GSEARCFDYVYDFGDDWHHVVLLEDRHVRSTGRITGIQCVAGENACPPEDVGGPHGYRNFLLALADPKHDQNAEYREWIGNRAFSPAEFNLSAAQRAVARIKN